MDIELRNTDPAPTPAQPGKPAARATVGQDEASPFMALLAAMDMGAQIAPLEVSQPPEQPAGQPAAELPPLGGDAALPADAVPLAGLVPGWAPPGAQAPAATGQPTEPAKAPVADLLDTTAATDGVVAGEMLATAAGRRPRTAALMQQQAQDAQSRVSDARTQDQRVQAERGARAEAQVVDARMQAPALAQAAASTSATTAEVFASLARAPQAQRSAERQAARAGGAEPTLLAGAAGYDGLVQSNGAAMGPTTVSAMVPTGATATAALAEKLSFWMGRGVQTAELQLEALDGATVDVRIDLQGRDAKVEFRSDMPEARRWLQDAMPQLQEMLQDEGLRLSGGFVGSSAQGRGEAGERGQTRPQTTGGARTGIVRMEPAEALPRTGNAARMPGQGMGRSVDLFV